ncbi:hypothetical protein GCM10019059_24160 [Camelimonas fluminis]|uniref:ParB/RepB/Spo0J family partition protein n=1 Tax=Camelimonas fluminis TaxID=1576911 RepID=A0ABV7UBD4_9HYPH|nr:ParB/RepB/Spo0J family partition protein [Camelimonas fluminis]GHE63818.1 hypothetical protein GCM10019059_24160 [Camelimonas fluminis]
MTDGLEYNININDILVADRLRVVSEPHVAMIMASLSEVGQLSAIAVARATNDANAVILVDGEHRLEAAKRLEWTEVRVYERNLTPEEREKHEIHANIIRAELNPLDRAVFLGRLGDIFERENPGARNGGDRKSRKYLEKNQFANLANWSEFSKEASRRTGVSARTIYRARDLAAHLSPEAVALIRGTPLADNQSQLQALAQLPAEEQVTVARTVANGRAANVAKARVAAGLIPAGGAVRQEDGPLVKLEAQILRLSLAQLRSLRDLVDRRIAAKEGGA